MLTCDCDSELFDFDDGSWGYEIPDDFTILNTKRRKRCCSCKQLIGVNAQCVKFGRLRSANTDIEERIYGNEVRLAPWFMCESCGEIFLNLSAIGYCLGLGENMHEELAEYWALTGFKLKEEKL